MKTFRSLAEAMGGISVSKAHELNKETWFPRRDAGGWWTVADCLAAVARNKRGEPPLTAVPMTAPAETPAAPAVPLPEAPDNELFAAFDRARAPSIPPVISKTEGELLKVLETSSDISKLAEASALLGARRLAAEATRRQLPSKAIEDFTRGLEELRRTADGVFKLGRERGDYIERDAAKACMGELARGMVLACERVGVRIATQYELWHADAAFNALTPDERARAIRQWTDRQTDQARIGEVEEVRRAEIERRVAAEIAANKTKKREVD